VTKCKPTLTQAALMLLMILVLKVDKQDLNCLLFNAD